MKKITLEKKVSDMHDGTEPYVVIITDHTVSEIKKGLKSGTARRFNQSTDQELPCRTMSEAEFIFG